MTANGNNNGRNRNSKALDDARIEQELLKGTIDESIGVFCDLFSAKSNIEGQNGGVITAMLMQGLSEGTFDSAIVVRNNGGYNAEAVVAENAKDAWLAKGTNYLKVNVTEKLRELAEQGKKKIAIVCTPCEARAARKIKQSLPSDCTLTIIGLFCFEAFNCTRLKEEVAARLGVDLTTAERTHIRHGKFMIRADGKEYSCRVRELENAAEKSCQYCDDFTSRLADISVGAAGSKEGYSTVIVRSHIGEKTLHSLDFVKESVDKEEILKLCHYKRTRAEKNFAELENKP